MENLTSKPHVLWITERYPPMTGGMAESAGRQVRSLRKRGYNVHVLVFVNSHVSISVKRTPREMGLDILVTHTNSPGNAAQRAWREVLTCHTKIPYDIVMGFGAGLPGYCAVTYCAWLKISSVVSVRGNDFDRDWFDPRRASFVQESLRRADIISAVTQEKVSKIKALFPEKQVIWQPNGIRGELWDILPGDQQEREALRTELAVDGRRIVGLFGELKYKKRIPMWLSAIREAGLNYKISLLIVGRTDHETDSILADPVLAPLHLRLPFRSPESMVPLYHACDYLAVPSLFEGFPNVLLEAMASGVVPLVSDAGSMEQIITHGVTGFVFPAENRTEAGRVTSEALKISDDKLQTMKRAVKECVKKEFTLEKETDILESAILGLTTYAH